MTGDCDCYGCRLHEAIRRGDWSALLIALALLVAIWPIVLFAWADALCEGELFRCVPFCLYREFGSNC